MASPRVLASTSAKNSDQQSLCPSLPTLHNDNIYDAQSSGAWMDDDAWEQMSLEDFLTKAVAVREEDVGATVSDGNHAVKSERVNKRRAAILAEETQLDKAMQQKQRRMIKNRESAARSRQRKQAYTVELETLVTQLEQEKARLIGDEVEQRKKRFKELMENLIPVVEKQKPRRPLRRVNSMQW